MSRLNKSVAHILVCDHKHCIKRGARECIKQLRTSLREHGLRRSVVVTTVECLDECDDGPVVCVYPDGIWYRDVDENCARDIIEQHLIRNRLVSRHVMYDMAEARANLSSGGKLEKADDTKE